MLEALLSKQRMLEIYLNHVEWGEGVFGAQAAARHYYGVDASAAGTRGAGRPAGGDAAGPQALNCQSLVRAAHRPVLR
jgi:membrane peptidoglycan carboxypeptidase